LTIWHCILSAELIKTHSFRLLFGDFANWVYGKYNAFLEFPHNGYSHMHNLFENTFESLRAPEQPECIVFIITSITYVSVCKRIDLSVD